ncbi:MAG: hypothetical protein EB121_06430, partial [Alphaproteobacteria bacterium]|nr:hypothetical protein [Alphaproteobacteria bacterium]
MATPVHKMQVRQAWLLKDPRPVYVKLADYFGKFEVVGALLMFVGLGVAFLPIVPPFAESFTWVLNSTDFIFL